MGATCSKHPCGAHHTHRRAAPPTPFAWPIRTHTDPATHARTQRPLNRSFAPNSIGKAACDAHADGDGVHNVASAASAPGAGSSCSSTPVCTARNTSTSSTPPCGPSLPCIEDGTSGCDGCAGTAEPACWPRLAPRVAAAALGGILLKCGGCCPDADTRLDRFGPWPTSFIVVVLSADSSASRRRRSALARTSFRFLRRRAEHQVCRERWSTAHACRISLPRAPFLRTALASNSWSVSETCSAGV